MKVRDPTIARAAQSAYADQFAADLYPLVTRLQQGGERTHHLPPPSLPQISLSLRKSLRKELVNLANEAELTMRAFILSALKEKGLSVTDDDLADLRKGRGER